MKVTLKDIAEKSGYSISTVSRVLNGSGNISLGAQKAIVKVAEELEYPFIQSKIPLLSNGKLHIALVTDFREGEFYSSFFFGFSKAAQKQDIKLSLFDISTHSELCKIMEDLDEHNFDGICLFMPEMDQEDYMDLAKSDKSLPVVSNAMIQSPVVPTITFDGYSGGHLAAEYFIEKGYQSFGIVRGPFEKAESRFRYNGFRDHLEQCGKSIMWETTGNFKFQSGVEAYKEYAALSDKPEALFISNDLMCKGFMEGAKMDGVKIPDEVALISYDDLPMCKETYPAITSVSTNFFELGKETFKVLQDIITNKQYQKGTLNLLPVSLAKRDTA